MLTRVVLPAPLLPIRLTRSPAARSTCRSAAATTAPKRLFRPRASSSGGVIRAASVLRTPARALGSGPARSSAPLPVPERADALRQEADHEQQEDAERELPGVREVRARERAHDLQHRAG